jgi:hypothetical protein
MHSSETSVHIRTTRCYIPEDGNIHNYRCENLGSYTAVSKLFLVALREAAHTVAAAQGQLKVSARLRGINLSEGLICHINNCEIKI